VSKKKGVILISTLMILLGIYSYENMNNGILVFLLTDGTPIIGGVLILRIKSKEYWIITLAILFFYFLKNIMFFVYYFDYLISHTGDESGLLHLFEMNFYDDIHKEIVRCVSSFFLIILIHTKTLIKKYELNKEDSIVSFLIGTFYYLIVHFS
jgi:hypothetical protein